MRIKTITTIIIGFIIAITSPFIAFAASDTPHNTSKTVSCGNCHGKTLLYSPFWGGSYTPADIDDTVYNKICLECHTQASGPYTTTGAPLARTHSSLATDNGYGNWTTECRNCHNPHYQRQSLFKRTDSSNLYLAGGTITSYVYNGDGTSTLGYSGISYKSGWDSTKLLEKTGSFRRAMLVPNVGKLGYNYPIIAIDGTTIKVEGDATATYQYISPPTPFAVMYGQYIKDLINVGGTNKTVKLLDRTGTKSFADGDGTYDGVCEVCHTQTTYHRNNSSGDHTHYAATNCSGCHLHADGFKGNCEGCHDLTPSTCKHATHFAAGTVNYNTTIQSTTDAYGFSCGICHYGTHLNTLPQLPNPHTVEVIFAGVATQDPDSPSPGSATYSPGAFSEDDPGTGWTFNYSDGTCSNIYCHGNYPGSGLNASPTFAGTASCGSCHGASSPAWPDSGRHKQHASNSKTSPAGMYWNYDKEYACTICHKYIVGGSGPSSYTIADKSKHVNGYVDWEFNTNDSRLQGGSETYSTATGTAVPSDGTTPRAYGTCNNIYCHSIAQTATGGPLTPNTSDYKTPSWGSPPDWTCICHNTINSHGGGMQTSGSHSKHFTYYFNLSLVSMKKCTICHKWTPTAAFGDCNQCHYNLNEKVLHVNGRVDILFDPYFGNGIFDGTPEPGDGFAGSTCSNTYCHSDGTSVSTSAIPDNTSTNWGSGAIACNACHGYPPAYANGSPKANSHSGHSGYTCNNCHYTTTNNGTTIASKSTHVNKSYDVNAGSGVSFTYLFATTGGTCSTVSCHAGGVTRTWGTP